MNLTPPRPAPEPTDLRRFAVALASARGLLEQGARTADRWSDDDFRAPSELFGGGSIGQHLRHALDHFEQFVRGVPEGCIDYDDRVRGRPEENCRATCVARADGLAARLDGAVDGRSAQTTVLVKTACSVDGAIEAHASTLGRELQFLVSHTVHHFAIVAAIARARGLTVDPDFGVAPSTLRYRAGN
ncbi:MAG: hypothetical protein U1F36_10775 [Planctomycetota bacterium]